MHGAGTSSRSHGSASFSFKFPWNSSTEMISVPRRRRDSTPHTPSPQRRGHGRQTVAWPFQSIVTEGSISLSTLGISPFRRKTWQPRGYLSEEEDEDDDSDAAPGIIPDYVVNYIRGETPETVARRKQNGGKIAERDVQVNTPHGHRHLRSHMVELGNFLDDDSAARSRTTAATRPATHPDFDVAVAADEKKGAGDGAGTVRRRLGNGWRGGVAINALLSFAILVIGFVSLVLAVTKPKQLSAESVVYSGSCAMATNIDWSIHAIIAIMTTILLAGGNYVFQMLCSPTRPEISEAHEHGKWLDVGVPSLRNLRHISPARAILGTVVLVAAVSAQVIYNAVILTPPISADTSTCTASLSNILLGSVVFLNLVIFLCTVSVLFRSPTTFEPLVTLGDALSSFLRDTDPTTRDACLLTKSDVRKGRWAPAHQEARIYSPTAARRWLAVPSLARWVTVSVPWVLLIATAAAGLAFSVRGNSSTNLSSLSPKTPTFLLDLHSIPAVSPRHMIHLALTALPHLVLAVLYLSTNSLLTTYFLSHEATLYATSPTARPLRVSSDPAGAQVSSLYLTLPRPYSWILLGLFAGISFVLGRTISILPPRSPSSTAANQDQNVAGAIAIGVSGLGCAILLALLLLLAAAVVGLGCRRIAPGSSADENDDENDDENNGEATDRGIRGNPLALVGGSCSAVLSAWCHGLYGERDAWMGAVSFGVVYSSPDSAVAHCSFSARGNVGEMVGGRVYR